MVSLKRFVDCLKQWHPIAFYKINVPNRVPKTLFALQIIEIQ